MLTLQLMHIECQFQKLSNKTYSYEYFQYLFIFPYVARKRRYQSRILQPLDSKAFQTVTDTRQNLE